MATEKYYSKRSEAVKRYNSMKPRTRSEFAEDITNERIMFSLCEMFSAIQPEEDRFDTKLNNIKKTHRAEVVLCA